MDRHRCVLWMFVAALLVLLAMPFWLPPRHTTAGMAPAFTWQKGVLLLAFACMAAAYVYWLVRLVAWLRSVFADVRPDPARTLPGRGRTSPVVRRGDGRPAGPRNPETGHRAAPGNRRSVKQDSP